MLKTLNFFPKQALNATAYSFSFIMLGILSAAEGPALPSLAKNTATSLDEVSYLFVFASLGYLLGSYFGGKAYDYLPGHRLMAVMLLLMSATAFFIPFARHLPLILGAFFLIGSAKGAVDVGGNTLLLWEHGRKAAPYINSLHFSFGLGATLAPLCLAVLIALGTSPLNIFILFALLFLPIALWLWFLPEPAHPVIQEERRKSATSIITILFILTAFVFYVGAEIGFGNWVYTYALTLGLGTETSAAYLTSAFWGIFTFGRLLGIFASSTISPKRILLINFFGSMLSMIAIILWQDSTLALWAGTIGAGLFMASIFPNMLMLADEQMEISGAITGWFLVGGGIGGMLLPWLIGQAFVLISPKSMPALVLFSLLANLGAVWGFWFLTRADLRSRG